MKYIQCFPKNEIGISFSFCCLEIGIALLKISNCILYQNFVKFSTRKNHKTCSICLIFYVQALPFKTIYLTGFFNCYCTFTVLKIEIVRNTDFLIS